MFRGIHEQLEQADVLAVNLECTIAAATTGTPEHKQLTYRAPPITAASLARVGVDVAGQANNHALDYGPDALAETRALLAERGIGVVGAGPDRTAAHAPLVIDSNGLRLAFLAYVAPFAESSEFSTRQWEAKPDTPGVAIGRPAGIAADVTAAREVADLVVVLLHAGYHGWPTPNRAQRDLARAAINAGATLVVGAHPHVLQGYRWRGDHLIAYSLGNFVFDQLTADESDSAILDVTLTLEGVTELRWIPVLIRNGLPFLAEGSDAERVLRRLQPI